MKTKKSILIIACTFAISMVNARESVGVSGHRESGATSVQAAGCSPATQRTDLDINNIRALIMNGGDMWWDQGLAVARYEVPKGSGKYSFFAAALWIGGIDAGGQLKTAAQTYRQTGNDFWPGALDKTNATIDANTCAAYDKIYQIYRQDVADFVGWQANPGDYPGYSIPQSILTYPGNGDLTRNEDNFLAPFYDNNVDGTYNPGDGDYPYYSLNKTVPTGGGCQNLLFGDQTLWWVFNDKGNIHSETGGQPIGLEVRAQGFAFATNDEINNMTFYQYQVFNRSNLTVAQTYFGSWNDPDIGDYSDDLIGCDVKNGLGFAYNGDDQDGSGSGNSYGANPPSIAIDFFKGPLKDPDGIDNPPNQTISGTGFGDSIKDNEHLGMEYYMVFKNDFSTEGNPTQATHYYNYLQSKWKDGTPLVYGGTGYGAGTPTKFAFPWTSDDANGNVDWECPTQADWRFIHSSGPFTLKPGAVNYVTTGCVWARTTSGGAKASVDLVRAADKKAQSLFDNCFQVLEGPRAPDLTVQEMNRELILYISNPNSVTFNNRLETYKEKDPLIVDIFDTTTNTTNYDKYYKFQGYLIYQVKDGSVTAAESDLSDPDKARLVVQCDLKDGVGQLVNYNFDQTLNTNVPVLKNPTINGYNGGIKHSFKLTTDAFAAGSDKNLVNHKTYYFLAIAYGSNIYKAYDPNNAQSIDGQKTPYISGAKNSKGKAVAPVSGIPHITAPENGGTTLQCDYGAGPKLKRVEGQGNGNQVLELSKETVDEILASSDNRSITPIYDYGKGPVDIKVIDPLNIPNGNFELKLIDSTTSSATSINRASWSLTNTDSNITVLSDESIAFENEQLILQWGLSVRIIQTVNPGVDMVNNQNGYLTSSYQFTDPTKPWLIGLPDQEGPTSFNWIRSGTYKNATPPPASQIPPAVIGDDYKGVDDNQFYEHVLQGTFAPYFLTSKEYCGPFWSNTSFNAAQTHKDKLALIPSVDLIITNDKTKWTRCPVLEMQDDINLAEGKARKFDLRKHNSKDKDGNDDGSGQGMSWFPGYAINVETGERLNMAFGEDSWLIGENGQDMLWNPTESITDNFFNNLWGGKHFIYIFNHNHNTSTDMPKYDMGQFMQSQFNTASPAVTPDANKINIFKDCAWVGIPLLNPTYKVLDTDVKIEIRVAKPYAKGYSTVPFVIVPPNPVLQVDPNLPGANPASNGNNPLYSFNTADLYAIKGDKNVAKNALDLINVVPNPYYAYSAYEPTTLDNIVKITNLPQTCTISIYTVNGTLIRKFSKDDPLASLDWDLKNQKSVPISSGLYIIHVNVPDVGEKIVKFFGVMRPIDLQQF